MDQKQLYTVPIMDIQSGIFQFLYLLLIAFFLIRSCYFSRVQWDRSERSSSMFDRRFKRHINPIQKRSLPQDDEGWLVLDNVGSSDNGVFYTCTVSSPTGEMAKRTIEIIVTQPPVLDELSFGTNVKEGEIAKVVCSLKSGDTPVFFSWLKDGASIPAILKVTLNIRLDRCFFRFRNLVILQLISDRGEKLGSVQYFDHQKCRPSALWDIYVHSS